MSEKYNEEYIHASDLYENAVQQFEELEKAVHQCIKKNQRWKAVQELQNICLNTINNLINIEDGSLYFQSLMHIREDLKKHAKTIQNKSDQIIVNGITITKIKRTNDSSCSNEMPECAIPRKLIKIDEFEGSRVTANVNESIVEPTSKGLCDIAGLDQAKSLLKEAVVFPKQFPHLFAGARKPWNKALLYGPPGTGKTQLAHSIAAEVNAQLYCISNADLLSRYVGESEKFVRSVFQNCQRNSKLNIVFIDEVDSLCRRRNSNEAEHDRRIKNELLKQLSEMDRNENNKIFLLAATNCPWDIDPAFIRRFQRRIYISLPDRETRLKIIELHLNSVSNSITDHQWKDILDKTEGWSGSDIADLINCAMYQPLKDLENATHWVLTAEDKYLPVKEKSVLSIQRDLNSLPANRVTVRAVEKQDFIQALSSVTKTITSEEIKRFEIFNNTFGTIKPILQD